jgi:hypothetical protein
MPLPGGRDTPQGCEETARSLAGLGEIARPRQATPPPTTHRLWRGEQGGEQYRCSSVAALCADPVARLHLRDKGFESVGVLVGDAQLRVCLGADELSVMSERDVAEGVSVGVRESRKVMRCCMDLLARKGESKPSTRA